MFISLFHEKLFVTLVCYADETGVHDATGKHHGAEVAAVAGYLSWKEDWAVFTPLWQAVLDRYGVAVFHMAEFANEKKCAQDCESPYHNWSRDQRDRFVHELIPIARDNALAGFSGLISVRDYDRLMPEELKKGVVHPYYFCFQLFFDTVLESVRNKFDGPFAEGEQVAFFFDQQDEFGPKALEMYKQIHLARDAENRMGAISFVDSRRCPPLQAADLLAFRTRKTLSRSLKGDSPLVKPGSWDEALTARGNVITSYYDEPALRSMLAALERGDPMFAPSARRINE